MEKPTNNLFISWKFLFGFLFFCFFGLTAKGQNFDLSLTVAGIDQSAGGKIKLGVFNSHETFKTKSNPLFEATLAANDTIEKYTFKEIPSGLYAIALFHDENGDNTLNTKKLGIPSEGVGFSGEYKGKIKPPNFKDASFQLTIDTTIFTRIHYTKK